MNKQRIRQFWIHLNYKGKSLVIVGLMFIFALMIWAVSKSIEFYVDNVILVVTVVSILVVIAGIAFRYR